MLAGRVCKFRNVLLSNLTSLYGATKEPSKEGYDDMLSAFPNSWVDGKSVVPAKHIAELISEQISEDKLVFHMDTPLIHSQIKVFKDIPNTRELLNGEFGFVLGDVVTEIPLVHSYYEDPLLSPVIAGNYLTSPAGGFRYSNHSLWEPFNMLDNCDVTFDVLVKKLGMTAVVFGVFDSINKKALFFTISQRANLDGPGFSLYSTLRDIELNEQGNINSLLTTWHSHVTGLYTTAIPDNTPLTFKMNVAGSAFTYSVYQEGALIFTKSSTHTPINLTFDKVFYGFGQDSSFAHMLKHDKPNKGIQITAQSNSNEAYLHKLLVTRVKLSKVLL